MVLELQKYECYNEEYLIYDCNKNHYEFGAREARVMCSQGIGLIAKKVIVGPIIRNNEISLRLYNPDGSDAEPQVEDIMVFAKYLEDAGYPTTLRSDSGRRSNEAVHKVCKMAFFENFIAKYDLKESNAG